MRNALKVPDPLLVSCPNGGGMALLDGHLCLQLSDSDSTGLAVGRDAVYWCLQEDGARFLRELRDGQLRTAALSDDPLDLHDVMLHGEDLFVAATQTNEVLRLDRRLAVRERWSLGEGEPDSSHVNCLAVHDGRLVASIFGRFTTHRGYKGKSRGAGQVIDVRNGETLLKGLSQPHSMVAEGDLLYVCSSEDKEVVVYEGLRKARTIALPGYTRGLAVGGEHLYVGLSCSRNLEIESQTGYFESGAVAILRKDDLEVIGTVQVPWREIYDIRIVGDRRLLQSLLAASWERERATSQTSARQALENAAALSRDSLQQAASREQASAAKLRDALEQAGEARTLAARSELRVKDLEAQVALLNDVVHKRNERLARVRLSHAQVGALAIRRQCELEAREAQISELERRVEARGEDIAMLSAIVEQKEQSLETVNARAAELEASLSQARTGEAVHRRRVSELAIQVARLEEVSREFDLVKRSRSWRLTKPLRFVTRLLRNGGLAGSDRERVLSWLGLAPRGGGIAVEASDRQATGIEMLPPPPPSAAPAELKRPGDAKKPPLWRLRKAPEEIVLAPQQPGQDDIYVWAVIDWHFRIQRPQHLARELAATGRRVFYVSNNFIDAPEPGFRIEPLDGSGRLFQVFLHVAGRPVIYFDPPDAQVQARLDASLRTLLLWTRSNRTVSLVQHPFWAHAARSLPNHRLVYDCMDHHGGFENNSSGILALEEELMRAADLLVVSSVWLDEEGSKVNDCRALIRNAGQYEHFSSRPDRAFSDPQGRRVIGYYGAIAPWFDVELVERVATDNPDCLVLLVGADTCGARERLAHRANIAFTGEVPYADLPYYLYCFDVCMLPFQVLPLTLATNPVKAYEYLSAGKPVVTVDLPEMRQFGGLVRISADADAFLDNVRQSLDESEEDPVRQERREFASDQTWAHRAGELLEAIASIPEPKVSVVVLAYNNLELTKACLESIELHSDYPNLEVIVVDNASSDGSQDYLHAWAEGPGNRRLLANSENLGFAAGNNQGLEAATGEYLVLLNNDTQVTPGWLRTMLAHLKADPSIGIIGPVTNNIGNEARIETDYEDSAGMLAAAAEHTLRHAGGLMVLRTVAFFCAMVPRHVYERVGGLDEEFGIGFFEDDDYCRRVEALGLRVVCAEDVFVHHHLSASFNKLAAGERKELFDRNRAIYEAKWGEWMPHRYRGKGQA